jgi:hypothetical protein
VTALAAMLAAHGWRRAWSIDFEFRPSLRSSWRYEVVCMIARCLITGDVIELWLDGLPPPPCPFALAKDELFIAYSAIAEATCFQSLNWPRPTRFLDPMIEFVRLRNGVTGKDEKEPSLLQALLHFGLPAMSAEEKDTARQLILRGGPYTPEEIRYILDYCRRDVEAAAALCRRLFLAAGLTSPLCFRQAVQRGRYMSSLAPVEATGNPFDMPLVKRFLRHWRAIQRGMIAELGSRYSGVFVNSEFSEEGFAAYLVAHNMPWPRTKKRGALLLEGKALKRQLDHYPEFKMLFDLRAMLNKTRLGIGELSFGQDGRARARLRPFISASGRNQPSSTRYIYGASSWLRFLLQPPPGRALILLDYATQEIGILAALSEDSELWATYLTGETYCTLAVKGGLAPEGAIKKTHPVAHAAGKILGLGLQYGMTERGAAALLKIPFGRARALLVQQRLRYAKAWAFSSYFAKRACEGFPLETCGGWRMHWPPGSRVKPNMRTARNWPVQAHGAEIMRLALILLVEVGIAVCGPIHDAFMIECDAVDSDRIAALAQNILIDASEMVLGAGYRLGVDRHIFRHPEHYDADKGRDMFKVALRYLEMAEAAETGAREAA